MQQYQPKQQAVSNKKGELSKNGPQEMSKILKIQISKNEYVALSAECLIACILRSPVLLLRNRTEQVPAAA